MDITEWIYKCINGTGGLRAFHKYENLGIEPDDMAIAGAEWILICLVQPESHMVLAEVNAAAAKRKDGGK